MSHTPEQLADLLVMIEAAAPVEGSYERLALDRKECLMLGEAIQSLRQDAIAAGGQVQEAHEALSRMEAQLAAERQRAKELEASCDIWERGCHERRVERDQALERANAAEAQVRELQEDLEGRQLERNAIEAALDGEVDTSLEPHNPLVRRIRDLAICYRETAAALHGDPSAAPPPTPPMTDAQRVVLLGELDKYRAGVLEEAARLADVALVGCCADRPEGLCYCCANAKRLADGIRALANRSTEARCDG